MEKHQPSNGTDGMCFMDKFCANCVHNTLDDPCDILGATFIYSADDPEYPNEWTYDDQGEPICTAFSRDADLPPPRCDKTLELPL